MLLPFFTGLPLGMQTGTQLPFSSDSHWIFSFHCPSFLRVSPSAKTVVNLFQPFAPSLPSSLPLLEETLKLLLLPPRCPTEVNTPDHGDHLLGLLEPTILILCNLEIPDCDASGFGNGQA